MTQLPSLPGENSQLSPNLLHAGKLERALSCDRSGQPLTAMSRAPSEANEVSFEKGRIANATLSLQESARALPFGRARGDLAHTQLNNSDTERPS